MVQSIFFFHVLLPMGYLIRNRLTMIRVYERHRDKLKIYVDELYGWTTNWPNDFWLLLTFIELIRYCVTSLYCQTEKGANPTVYLYLQMYTMYHSFWERSSKRDSWVILIPGWLLGAGGGGEDLGKKRHTQRLVSPLMSSEVPFFVGAYLILVHYFNIP